MRAALPTGRHDHALEERFSARVSVRVDLPLRPCPLPWLLGADDGLLELHRLVSLLRWPAPGARGKNDRHALDMGRPIGWCSPFRFRALELRAPLHHLRQYRAMEIAPRVPGCGIPVRAIGRQLPEQGVRLEPAPNRPTSPATWGGKPKPPKIPAQRSGRRIVAGITRAGRNFPYFG